MKADDTNVFHTAINTLVASNECEVKLNNINFHRRLFCLIFNLIFNHKVVYLAVGFLNKRWKFLRTIFVGYSVEQGYLEPYAFPSFRSYIKTYKWTPFLAGFFIQDGKLGLKFFISSNEDDFYRADNKENLIQFASRVEDIRQISGATQNAFAGVLPGVLYRNRIIRSMSETEVVIKCILKGISKVQTEEGYIGDIPLIVLGGNGFIGRRVIRQIKGRDVYCVDLDSEEQVSYSWPAHLKGSPAILINISRSFVLSNYIPHVWRELVLLNEVYPEPSPKEVESYKEKGSSVYHLAGVKGRAYPSFPKGYSGAIPCCAAWMNQDIEVVLKKLGG
ncbi:hypothetical protein [Nostoc sp. FACHB-888]|uniref:hypothetical protein n=1 Tax=Nostoc sp. FACHB-888 TaxID=2692842 RepID=UPI00168A1A20|nr:hypothetical protein [Nostoc sp. FACHB-888]MBD2248700.1 hypothetical protein [Nostoc sp. FACHB-888]